MEKIITPVMKRATGDGGHDPASVLILDALLP